MLEFAIGCAWLVLGVPSASQLIRAGEENMHSVGNRLKKIRERLNLRYRDVEQASHAIAKRHGNNEFIIALSRLSDIENKGTLPSLYRLYSLSAIYRLNISEVLRWYGLPLDHIMDDAFLCPQPSTHLMPFDAADFVNGNEQGKLTTRLDLKQTRVLSRDHRSGAWLAYSLFTGPTRKSVRFGIIGEQDEAMAPLLPAGSIVIVDDSRKKIAKGGWSSEAERPIYFLEARDGFFCRWCSLEDGELLALPHPASTQSPRRYRYPEEIEVVGEVMGVAMPRPQVRQSRARS